jgi:type II secretory pathway predicted ATPase ExeA
MSKKLLSLYGLKWNPFTQELPSEALLVSARIDRFCWRIEQALVREGGFALIQGEPGMGKSVALRILAERLGRMRELRVASMAHPQSNLADFYREMGELFGVPLKPHNRWGGFRTLRENWQAHIESSMLRPVLLIDEAQEMNPSVLNELRLLASTHFDSRIILSVVLCGDQRLVRMLQREELLPLGSRIRMRLPMETARREDLMQCLEHLLHTAGNASLMTSELKATLCDHACGNLRILRQMSDELLAEAAAKEKAQLDEQLFLEYYSPSGTVKRKSSRTPAGREREA